MGSGTLNREALLYTYVPDSKDKNGPAEEDNDPAKIKRSAEKVPNAVFVKYLKK